MFSSPATLESHFVSHCAKLFHLGGCSKYHFLIAVVGMAHWRSHPDKETANVET